jgi:hydrogenase nickel incorporation protein HypB
MCATCGCGEDAAVTITLVSSHEHVSDHAHQHASNHADGDHEHGSHTHEHVAATQTITMEQRVLHKNDEQARANRGWFGERGIAAVNLMSSPGSGKTTILERTIRELRDQQPIAVLEGDQETQLDAERVRAAGSAVVQVNTGAGCHLDAVMVQRGLAALDPRPGTLVFVENVGNLVCPALFDLGERARAVVVSVTEGEDKPLKYPHMFRSADLVLINKADLLPYVNFSVDRFSSAVAQLNNQARIVTISALTGDGMSDWYDWLRRLPALPQPV